VKVITPSARPRLLAFTLTATSFVAGSAHGGGPCAGHEDCAPGTRHARCEYAAEHRQSRFLSRLDCAGLACYSESLRAATNAHVYAMYHRPPAFLPVQAPASPTLVPTLPNSNGATEPAEPPPLPSSAGPRGLVR